MNELQTRQRITQARLSDRPSEAYCSSCKRLVITKVDKSSSQAWRVCCVLSPFSRDSCNAILHKCPFCKTTIAELSLNDLRKNWSCVCGQNHRGGCPYGFKKDRIAIDIPRDA